MGLVELLRTERSYRRLWLAQVVSEVGDWFQLVALVSMFPTNGSGAAIIAGLFVARNVVAALVTPIAGVLADRFHRGRVMIAADVARAAVVLCFLFVRGPRDVVLVYVLSLLLEALAVVFEPARGAAIPQVVPPRALLAANVIGGATWSTAVTLGSLAGGVVAARFGREAAFVGNAASFLASAILVHFARIPALPDVPVSAKRFRGLDDYRDGLAYLRTHRPQASLLGLKPGALLSGASFVLVSVFADRVFRGENAITMGWLMAGRGLGALVLPIVFARVLGRGTSGTIGLVLGAFPLAVGGFVAFSFAPSVALASLALFFAHGSTSTIWICSAQLLQSTVPNRVLGRVLAIELALVTAAIAFSGLFVGALLSRFGVGPRMAAMAMAGLVALPGLLWARNRWVHGDALVRAQAAAASVTPER